MKNSDTWVPTAQKLKKKKDSNAPTPPSMQECKAVGPNTSSMVAKDWVYNVNLYIAI